MDSLSLSEAAPRMSLAFYKEHWKGALLLAIGYLASVWLSEVLFPHPSTLFPGSAVALSALFLVGIELWPVVYLSALIANLVLHAPLVFVIAMPVAQTLQAVIGAHLLRMGRVDPLFRRSRDIFILIGTVILVSVIVPTAGSLANEVFIAVIGAPHTLTPWPLRYTGTLFCLFIITPFFMRWFSKKRFSRTREEALETIAVFAVLIGINYLLFIQGMSTIEGIPTVYFLLLPLFWIALRLRPRFITLALILTSICAVMSLYVGPHVPSAAAFDTRLFQTEEFLIAIGVIFFIMSSLEENRRLNSNLIRSQVATLENVIAKISSESEVKNDFIAVLAHELRNPLAPIMSGIEVLTLKSDRTEDEIYTLDMMRDRMQTVRRLLDDLLDISRIAEGKLSLKKETIDLEHVLQRAILSTNHYLKERHQSLSVKAPRERLHIAGDPVRIEQVFSNLITNASKYSNSGDHINIELTKKGGEAEVIFADHGIGISPDAIEKIFTPFHQANRGARAASGLGIGLALVRSFVEMHKGVVTVHSDGVGQGSEFRVVLPLVFPMSSVASGKSAAAKEKNPQAKIKLGPRILVVDDNDVAAWSMGKLLEVKGCTVFYAYTSSQALEQVAHTSPDVILLDIGLPDLDGYETAKKIRAHGFRGKLIALTGYSTNEARMKGMEAGFDHYLIKPAGLADLTRVLPELG